MGFENLVNKAKEALAGNPDKVEQFSDQGIEKAKEALGNSPVGEKLGTDKLDAAGEFVDGKIGE